MFEPKREPDYVENLIATNRNFSLLGSFFSEVIERPHCGYEAAGVALFMIMFSSITLLFFIIQRCRNERDTWNETLGTSKLGLIWNDGRWVLS